MESPSPSSSPRTRTCWQKPASSSRSRPRRRPASSTPRWRSSRTRRWCTSTATSWRSGTSTGATWRAAFAAADVVVEGKYHAQLVDHAYLEPEAGVGWLDGDGVLNIRVSTQVVEHYRDVARILAVPESKVRVMAPYVGGGFGGKEDMTVEPYVALAAWRTRRPVRMQWTRDESLLARAKRHPMRMSYRTAAQADGTILGQDIEITADAGAYAYLSAPRPAVLLRACLRAVPERRRAAACQVRLHEQPAHICLPWLRRDAGRLRLESQMNRLAVELGIAAGRAAQAQCPCPGDSLPVGQRLETEVLLGETIDAVYELAGEKPQPDRPAQGGRPRHRL